MKPKYTNNRKAPRMKKGEFSYLIINTEAFKRFQEEHPEYSSMSYHTFYKYWTDLAEIIRYQTVNNPLGVRLGAYTGELKLQYLPYKFDGADHAASTEAGESVKHLNLVTKGKTAKLKWERRWAVKFNRMLQYFAFESTREMNKMANKYIEANPEKLRVARVTLGKKKK